MEQSKNISHVPKIQPLRWYIILFLRPTAVTNLLLIHILLCNYSAADTFNIFCMCENEDRVLSYWDPYVVFRCGCLSLFIATWWSGHGGIEVWSQWPTGFIHCFDAVGWVIWPVKIVPEMTYNVSCGTFIKPLLIHCFILWGWQIRHRVGEIQEAILKQNELLKPALIALPKLHLTVLVMHIADDLQLNRYLCIMKLLSFV